MIMGFVSFEFSTLSEVILKTSISRQLTALVLTATLANVKRTWIKLT